MVDADDKVVIVDIDGADKVLFKTDSSNWSLEYLGDFTTLISELGSIEVDGVQQSNTVTFTVGEVDYEFNTQTGVINPDLEVE